MEQTRDNFLVTDTKPEKPVSLLKKLPQTFDFGHPDFDWVKTGTKEGIPDEEGEYMAILSGYTMGEGMTIRFSLVNFSFKRGWNSAGNTLFWRPLSPIEKNLLAEARRDATTIDKD